MVDNDMVITTAIKIYLEGRILQVKALLDSIDPFDLFIDGEYDIRFNEGLLAAYEDTLDVIPDIIKDYTTDG